MTFAIILDNVPLELRDGVDYDLVDGERYSFAQILAMTDAQRQALGVLTVQEPGRPNEQAVAVTGYHFEVTDSVPVRVYDTASRSVPERQARMLDDLAALRWQRETGGMVFGMAIIPTDDRSKLLIMGAREKAKEDATYTKRWKVAAGQYIDLEAATIIALSEALEAHVAACFAREEQLATQVAAAATHADLDAIDLASGWPANQ